MSSEKPYFFMVVGPQGSGKTTFGKMLAELRGTQFTETSMPLILVEMARLKSLRDRYGINQTYLQQDLLKTGVAVTGAWDSRRNRPARQLLVALGDALTEVFPGLLTQWCFSKGDVAAGCRRRSELVELRKTFCHRLKVLYVDRSNNGTERSLDNFELTPEDADLVVENTTIEKLRQSAEMVAKML